MSLLDPIKFQSLIFPGKIPDGHCAMCAFNTYLSLLGYRTQPAFDPDTKNYKIFSNWFYKKFTLELDKIKGVFEINNEDITDMNAFEEIVKNTIKEKINNNDVLLLSVDGGSHWYTAIHKDDTIYFIDAQSGIGFNVYTQNKRLPPDTEISVIKIPQDIIEEYFRDIQPQYASNGGRKYLKKKRTNKYLKKKHLKKKHSRKHLKKYSKKQR